MVILLSLFNIGCEDVIEVQVPSEEPRLIIDALVRVDESEPFVTVTVKVGLTSAFFGEVPLTEAMLAFAFTTTAFVDAELVPHELPALTVMLPFCPALPAVTVMDVVPAPPVIDHPEGTVQV